MEFRRGEDLLRIDGVGDKQSRPRDANSEGEAEDFDAKDQDRVRWEMRDIHKEAGQGF